MFDSFSMDLNVSLVFYMVLIFLLGKRVCLGESLAKQELFLIFTRLMQKFKVVASEDHALPSEQGYQGLIHSPLPFYAKLIPRNNAI